MIAYTNWNHVLIAEHERRLLLIEMTAEKWNRHVISVGQRRFQQGVMR